MNLPLRVRLLCLAACLVMAVPLLAQPVLLGTNDGLYQLDSGDRLRPLLTGVDVRKILRVGDAWYFLTHRGVLYSRDLVTFEERNAGLPIKTIKLYDGRVKSFATEIQELKDLEVDPYNPLNLITATKDYVFVSLDGGLSWRNEGSPVNFPSLKAVAISSLPQLQIFVSHTIRGPQVKSLTRSGAASVTGAAWVELRGDLARSCPTLRADELADILIEQTAAGPRIWAANSFLPNIYRYDSQRAQFATAYHGSEDFVAWDSLYLRDGALLFVADGAVMQAVVGTDGAASAAPRRAEAETAFVSRLADLVAGQLKCLWTSSFNGQPLVLNELWLVKFRDLKPHRVAAEGRNGIYLQTGFMVQPSTRPQYTNLLTARNLNMLTIDIKDDYGRLRYVPADPLVSSIGRTVNPLDLEAFTADMHARGQYLVARIVVFKDEHLFNYGGNRFAVWDSSTSAAWRGYRSVQRQVEVPAPATAPPGRSGRSGDPDPAPAAGLPAPPATLTQTVTERELYGEHWVDPYCEEVWAYNIAIAREVIARGFDEVQFDYIRFPTDGENLGSVRYRWKDAGMDMESALMSFLSYARANIEAPIGIDIYGANGWYRSGVRTGQDVELLSRYVDVILPMFYPSHFDQTFMEFAPAVLRPFRIYYLGTLRNHFIARRQVVVRPWVQAFYINVRYDREFYNQNYVNLQIDGVRHALNAGLTFWNNSGRYDDVPVLNRGEGGGLGGPNLSVDTPWQP